VDCVCLLTLIAISQLKGYAFPAKLHIITIIRWEDV
jgi:hypothetical protein